MHRVRWSVGWAAGLPGAVPRSWVCFYCRGTAASLHLVSVLLVRTRVNDHKQSLIKLQRTLPRNPCASVYGDDYSDRSFVFVCECECATQMTSIAEVCKSVCEPICMHPFDSVVAHCLMYLYCITVRLFAGMYACVWLIGAF